MPLRHFSDFDPHLYTQNEQLIFAFLCEVKRELHEHPTNQPTDQSIDESINQAISQIKSDQIQSNQINQPNQSERLRGYAQLPRIFSLYSITLSSSNAKPVHQLSSGTGMIKVHKIPTVKERITVIIAKK